MGEMNMGEMQEMYRKAELELESAKRANKAKTDFLSSISHDMRTPLNDILGLTSLLKENITDEDARHDLEELELSGKYLLNLINDTLDVNRIANGNLEMHPAVFDGRTIYQNAVSLAKTCMKGRNVTLNIHAEKIPFTLLYVDAGRLEQVIMNLFSNAVKFTPDGGSIDVTLSNLSVEEGFITDKLVVKDSGMGISSEFLPHIFETFSQENPSITGVSQGNGLGMAITKHILDLMNSTITVESEPGQGTSVTVILRLPIAKKEQIQRWKQSRIGVNNAYGLAGKRVLLCEDHPLNTQTAIRLLEAKGMLIEHAPNGEVAVNLFEHSRAGYYQLILMDIRMPIMDGIAATKKIRNMQHEDAKKIPIIAMTANAFAEDIKQTKDAGMNAHLSKPIQPEVLYRTMSELLGVYQEVDRQSILIVDDIETNRSVIRASLEEDYEILEAKNGREAMEIIENTPNLDAVITDIQMPEMNGIELIRTIRSNTKYRYLVIIANTQFGDPRQEEELLALGANDFVYKPMTSKIIEIRIRNALSSLVENISLW